MTGWRRALQCGDRLTAGGSYDSVGTGFTVWRQTYSRWVVCAAPCCPCGHTLPEFLYTCCRELMESVWVASTVHSKLRIQPVKTTIVP